MSRPDWDEYFLGIAEAVAARSDCERSKVGAVVVKDRRIRATGYNGSPAGKPGCGSCPRRTSGCTPGDDYDSGSSRCVAVHAEANALLYCNREDLIGATLYITRKPCYACEKLIDAAGVERVVTPETPIHEGELVRLLSGEQTREEFPGREAAELRKAILGSYTPLWEAPDLTLDQLHKQLDQWNIAHDLAWDSRDWDEVGYIEKQIAQIEKMIEYHEKDEEVYQATGYTLRDISEKYGSA